MPRRKRRRASRDAGDGRRDERMLRLGGEHELDPVDRLVVDLAEHQPEPFHGILDPDDLREHLGGVLALPAGEHRVQQLAPAGEVPVEAPARHAERAREGVHAHGGDAARGQRVVSRADPVLLREEALSGPNRHRSVQ